jgi:peptide/nickel transport system substrate-binding protein
MALAGLGDIATLDPALANTTAPILVVWQLYDRLIDIDENGRISPMIAESWTSSADVQEWRFKLRSDAFFQRSGDAAAPVTAVAVKRSLERSMRSPGYGRSLLGELLTGSEAFFQGKAEEISGIRTDGLDIILTLNSPFAFVPERLAASFFSIVSSSPSSAASDLPNGSGAYQVVAWDRTRKNITLKKNPKYWSATSPNAPQQVLVVSYDTEAVAVEELRAGNIDWLEASGASAPLLNTLRGRDARVSFRNGNDIRLVAINFERIPGEFQAALGRALNFATDRADLVRVLGASRPVGGPIPTTSSTPFEHRPEEARKLADTLPASLKSLEMLVMPGPESRTISERLQQQWASIGIRVGLKAGAADFFDRAIRGDYTLALGYFGPFVPSPEQYLWPYQAKAQPAPNVMRYNSEAFEKAFAAYVAEANAAAQEAALQRCLDALAQRPPAVWLVQAPAAVAVRGNWETKWSAWIPLLGQLNR